MGAIPFHSNTYIVDICTDLTNNISFLPSIGQYQLNID